MKHRVDKKSFGRKQGPRKALMKGLVRSLVEHERIRTTLPKAKELRRFAEKAVTLGRKQSVAARRLLQSQYPWKETVSKIVTDLSVRFKDRPGGYTRIIKLGHRTGDMAEMAYIEFVEKKEQPKAGSFKEDGGRSQRDKEKVCSKDPISIPSKKSINKL